MPKILQSFWEILKQAASDWLTDNAPRLGAALAYYTLFSLAPLVVVLIAVVGLVYGADVAQGHVLDKLEDNIGVQGSEVIRGTVESASRPTTGILGTVLGFIMLAVGATQLFAQVQDALNTIWDVETTVSRGFWKIVKDRFFSFVMVLTVALVLLASVAASTTLAAVAAWFGDWGASVRGHLIDLIINLAVLTLLFSLTFRYLPDAEVSWRDVWLGALVTAVLFTVGKFGIGLYLGHSGIATAYGAAGSVAVLLVWVYYSAQIFLFGAELTHVVAGRRRANALSINGGTKAIDSEPRGPFTE